MSIPVPRGLLFALFALSGFAGLIYESIWSHYLKLMLGHAAYAQTLVLVIFMGGMAIGSWLAGRLSQRVAHPLLWYVAVEATLGVTAFLFDGAFRMVQAWLFSGLIAEMDAGWVIDTVKWLCAASITLPQAIMLGATFPLMSAGLLRRFPNAPGSSLSWLYFSNSLGAAVGVLASGFYLIGAVGLPGTIMAAGLVNFALAAVVYLAERSDNAPKTRPLLAVPEDIVASPKSMAMRAMLLTAALTGAASFMYEIGWIRMLSLVLGSATHSFELMLSAFILGLALGSFYIRKHIDAAADPTRLLGGVQVLMAVLALLSLPLYLLTFDTMAAAWRALAPSVQGYAGFVLFSHLICLALMLPVTFCAGMTLPLITTTLLRAGHGEGSIGRVYAANTLGSIAGVLLAVHVVMPLLGLRWVVVVGALIDLALGAWLLMQCRQALGRAYRLALAGALLLAIGLAGFVRLDPSITASGVFRHGLSRTAGEVVFHRDGKTSTVDVIRSKEGDMAIATNGKIDAAIAGKGNSIDDFTMVLLGVVPMSMLPEAKDVGVIGMGSGRTVHVMLHNPKLERVDVVEIEPAMVEGARMFGAAVNRVYEDPRCHIIIEDAKTYFARNRRQYDLIVSEPSNPWVSGVATLFSSEFYKQIKQYIRPKGLFVQWLQQYEIDAELLSSVFGALSAEFPDYQAYYANDGDMLIVASPDGSMPPLSNWVFEDPGLKQMLAQLRINRMADLQGRMLGSAATLKPFFDSYGAPANSDYFPFLDQSAAKKRFMRKSAADVALIHPYSSRLEGREALGPMSAAAPALFYSNVMRQAQLMDDYYAQSGARELLPAMEADTVGLIDDLQPRGWGCGALALRSNWLRAVKAAARGFGPYMSERTGSLIVSEALAAPCKLEMDENMRDWLELLRAQTARDWPAMLLVTQRLLKAEGAQSPDAEFLLAEGLLAGLKTGGLQGGVKVIQQFESYPRAGAPVRYLLANIQ